MKVDSLEMDQWVEQSSNPTIKEFREAVHTILTAISGDQRLKANMVLKGGILLAVRYHSPRFTRDIDFSSSKTLQDVDPEDIVQSLNESLAVATESLDYDLDCIVQSWAIQPAHLANPTFPSINLKIGHAYRGSKAHQRLLRKMSPNVIGVDYSLNEVTESTDELQINPENAIVAYSLTDLIAEKYRALLQQVERNRGRRQDVYDLYLLLSDAKRIDDNEKKRILNSLLKKSKSRDIHPDITSIENKEVRDRAKSQYHTLSDEVEGELPVFEDAYDVVVEFYQSLPWDISSTDS